MQIVNSYLHLNSQHHEKCKCALKFILLATTSNLISLEVLQKCQHCQFCVLQVCPWCGVGLLRLFFLCCGVINKLTLLLVLAAPVKRKGARGEVRFPETPLLCALFYLKGPAPCCYWLAVTCLSYVLCLSLKAVLSRLVTVL